MNKINKLLAILGFVALTVIPALADTTIIPTIPNTLPNGTVADANAVMANFTAIQSYVNTNAAGNGPNTSITTLLGLSSPPAGAGSLFYMGTSVGGTANAVTVPTTYPGGFTMTTGTCIWWQPALTNTGSVTLNVYGKGPVTMGKPSVAGFVALSGGELVLGAPPVETCYNGAYWTLMNPQATVEAPLPYTAVVSATTTTISSSACPNFKCEITGTTAITGFGSSATVGQVFYLVFGGSLTLTYNATSMILPGAANITTAANDTAQATYLGSGNWQVLRYTAAIQPAGFIGGISPLAVGLTVTNDGSTPNSKIDVTAQSAVLTNTAYNASVTGVNISVVIDLSSSAGSSGNDLDTGSYAASTWYNVYLISNGTTVAGLASLSSTSPTLPTGYTYYMRVGAMSSNGSTQLYRTIQRGVKAQYQVIGSSTTPTYPILVNGSTGSPTTPTYTAFQVTGNGYVLPPTAQTVTIFMNIYGNGACIGAMGPNGSYGALAYNAAPSNPPPLMLSNNGDASLTGEFVLESNSVYAVSSCGSDTIMGVIGWTDAVAAH